LTEQGLLRRNDEIADHCQFHSAPKAITPHSGEGDLVGRQKSRDDIMENSQHRPDALGRVVFDVVSGGEGFLPRSAQDEEAKVFTTDSFVEGELEFGQRRDIEDVQRRSVDRDPEGLVSILGVDERAFVAPLSSSRRMSYAKQGPLSDVSRILRHSVARCNSKRTDSSGVVLPDG